VKLEKKMKKIFTLTIVVMVMFLATTLNAETIKFKSYTVDTYRDLLDGLDGAKEVRIPGKLIIPKSPDKVPAMIILHDSSGPNSRNKYWAKAFNKMGIATFQPNSYKGRGVTPGRSAPSKVQSMAMIIDAYQALEVLANHPKIDGNKVGIMGSCISGVSAVMSAWDPIRKVMGDLKFAAHISLYGLCFDLETLDMTGAPILTLAGENDMWMPASTCSDLGERLRAIGYPIKNVVYPGAPHLFDAGYSNKHTTVASLLDCKFLMKDDGTQVNTVCNLDDRDPNYIKCCYKKLKIPIGLNKNAKKQAMVEIKTLLTEAFQLKPVVEKVTKKTADSSETDR
jgi:dienelactone hydrolase